MLRDSLKSIALLTALALSGCATLPSGPSVNVLPAPGKPFEQFMADDSVCRQFAERGLGMSPQDTANQSAASGAALGTLVGAGAGALFGAAAGNPAAGVAIGAGSGLLFGSAAGASSSQYYGAEAQRRYDNTYVQCMYAKGNQVPGPSYRVRRYYPPPPPPPGYYP